MLVKHANDSENAYLRCKINSRAFDPFAVKYYSKHNYFVTFLLKIVLLHLIVETKVLMFMLLNIRQKYFFYVHVFVHAYLVLKGNITFVCAHTANAALFFPAIIVVTSKVTQKMSTSH